MPDMRFVTKDNLASVVTAMNDHFISSIPTATSSVAGAIKYDDSTLVVDGGGRLRANVPSVGGVDLLFAAMVPSSMFTGNSSVTSVSLPTCVAVGDTAFTGCANLSYVSLPACVEVGNAAFMGCASLTSAYLGKCVTVGAVAFSGCTSLSYAYLPACTTVDGAAFSGCTALKQADLHVCYSINGYAFLGCSNLSRVFAPRCRYVGALAFANCMSLANVDIRECTTIEVQAFEGCTALSTIELPVCQSIGGAAFDRCSSLSEIDLPSCGLVGNAAFRSCTSLSAVNLSACKSLGNGAFISCYNLTSLYLTSVVSVPTLGTSAFYSTPIGGYSVSAGQYGSVYVPMSLLASFRTAPNWSSIASRIVGIQTTPVDNATIKENEDGQLYADVPTKVSDLTNDSGFITSVPNATTSSAGLMSSDDKTKLNGIASGATANTAASATPKADGTAAVGTSAKYAREDHVHPTDTTRLAASLKGAANGVAELDSGGKVPSSQLPSYVDDVLEYSAQSAFPSTGEAGKIYVDLATNKTYRWSGSAYTEISPSLALGETSSTAYRGDRGKTAYDHAAAKGSAFSSGLYKITTNAQGHVTAATAVAKSDITGLGIPAQDTTYTAASATPKVDGTAAVGTSAKYAREDHVHPTDTSRAAASDLSSHTENSTVHVTASEKTTWNGKASTSVATASANGLMSSSDKTKINGLVVAYATCTTAANAQVKVATVSAGSFSLVTGAIVFVKFTNTNTYSATAEAPCQLNVGGTGAKAIYGANSGAVTGTNTTYFGRANYVNQYVYDGSYWVWMGSSTDNNNTYSNMSSAEMKAGTATSARSISAARIKEAFASWCDGDTIKVNSAGKLYVDIPSLMEVSY